MEVKKDVEMEEDSDSESSMSGEEEEDKKKKSSKVYLPNQPLEKGEHLVHDESSYVLYHQAQTGSPCLSFDIIPDDLKENRQDFPLTAYIAAGTQAEQGRPNHLIVMKMSNLHGTKKQTDSSDLESEDSDDEDEKSKPELLTAMVIHHGGVNRIRCTKMGDTHLAATFSDRRSVHIWDLSKQLSAVENTGLLADFVADRKKKAVLPLFTFAGHMDEGFALDWSGTVPGQLLSGDCKNNIHLWKAKEGGTWHVDQRPFQGHTGSVEDIQWSPNERSVFASCSVDQTVRIWDVRASPARACMLTTKAHDADVNVMDWNRNDPFIVTGGDDGLIKVWDLRQFDKGISIAKFKHHTAPITSVEWHKTDRSVFAASGSDDQLTQWDLAVETDDNDSTQSLSSIPPQLLFIHQGQKDIKELHWHSQIPGLIISTALDGFNVFRTISV
ncbi:unnamed protein product [Clavelina lepadiformis]|uniref:Glutamate-rich WD repeat-containing protein 1 n=1 Tax=Clavelina lepadiformis TaxID=159417 RepID=A0ABP0G935_CLALP